MTLFSTTYASPPAREGLLGPDAKSQVTVEYRDGRPARAHTIVVSHMHAAGLAKTDLEEIVRASLVAVLPPGWVDAGTRVLVNPSGSFVHGGPAADTGLTGRKIIVDTYGGAAPHGGGAFSGAATLNVPLPDPAVGCASKGGSLARRAGPDEISARSAGSRVT